MIFFILVFPQNSRRSKMLMTSRIVNCGRILIEPLGIIVDLIMFLLLFSLFGNIVVIVVVFLMHGGVRFEEFLAFILKVLLCVCVCVDDFPMHITSSLWASSTCFFLLLQLFLLLLLFLHGVAIVYSLHYISIIILLLFLFIFIYLYIYRFLYIYVCTYMQANNI